MRFGLEVLRARKGDCLIVHFGGDDHPRQMLVDGGPSGVYEPQLRPRLEHLRSERAQDEQDALAIDVLMVSHVDDDHIRGILELARELRHQKESKQPLLFKIRSLLHNSFDDLLGTTPTELEASVRFGTAALDGTIDVASVDDLDVAGVLASIPQGHKLREDAQFLGWKVNREFNGKLAVADSSGNIVRLDGGLELAMVGPLQPELAALQEAHDKWLKERAKAKATRAESALAAFVDKSIPNLSSLVVLARSSQRTMLLTGDARGDKILKGLQVTGLMGPSADATFHVDILKVPHHGSANNMEAAFFRRVTADHYVFSGNGEHGNPDRETLEMLFEARGNDAFELHFTYPLAEIDVEREKDWEKEQAKEMRRSNGKVRRDWSAKTSALAKFLTPARLGRMRTLRVVEEGTPHLIAL